MNVKENLKTDEQQKMYRDQRISGTPDNKKSEDDSEVVEDEEDASEDEKKDEKKDEADAEDILKISSVLAPKAEKIIQEGIKMEQDAAQLYESMGARLDALCFSNTSKWFHTHAAEERAHSNWVIDFLKQKNTTPILPEITKPDSTWEKLEDILHAAYKHEVLITNFWNKAATECLKCADHDAYQFCCFILKEQREEIELFSGLINLYNLTKGESKLAFDQNVKHPE